ncbi:glycoside hydrolase family 95 protein [Sporosarcina sp. YIM B06819]|uniref:glycoside hydrolase family 95 protein n=1 Tax=Sporosarcina sp. YIM B06819 TaxID=3081769 RepID=UPI00298C61BD|nr:glycoside hydrolase family 95 protein [Sporosarcina sp. YIM B06819]
MNILSYKRAAGKWTEALPLGNGRIGAMHFGGVEVDRFQLNEDSLWSGPPRNKAPQQDVESLQKVRKLIDEGQYEQAADETKNMFGPYTQAYMPLGDLTITYLHGAVAKGYKRELDIKQALSSVEYTVGQVTYKREAFISQPHQVLAIELTSSVDHQLNVMITLDSLLKSKTVHMDEELALQGICPERCAPVYHDSNEQPIHYGEMGESKAIHFEGRLGVTVEGGQVESCYGKLSIQHATKAVIYLSIATSFNGFNQQPGKDFNVLTEKNRLCLSKAMSLPYARLKQAHIEDYQNLFDRVELSIGHERAESSLDTDERVHKFGTDDLGMVELLFQYGRYLMIAASREGTQPTNLQGIWNDSTRPPWSSNYTLNINTEMNYWPAEIANLAECHQPLLHAIQELSVNGHQMVRERYGMKGWTAHHNTDVWRHAEPVGGDREGDPIWAFWPMSGPWLCRHLWEHYMFSQDRTFLAEEALPIMKGAAEFCLDWLVEDGNGYLLTSPSTSPEHLFRSVDGQIGSVTKGAMMDLQIIWDLFTNSIEAAAVLGIDDEWVDQVKTAKARLYPLQIGQQGQLQEWLKDYADVEPQHRHVSHLYGVFPGNQIFGGTLLEAARQTLNIRGDDGTGWSLGWKMNLWARLKDGERIYGLLQKLFNIVGGNIEFVVGGGLYPNLLGAHPPFQIDGNFGYTAGVIEMIVQSHQGFVELLPALPSTWAKGTLAGVRVRGGFEIDVVWDRMKVRELTVTCTATNRFVLKTTGTVLLREEGQQDREVGAVDGLIALQMCEGQTYSLRF